MTAADKRDVAFPGPAETTVAVHACRTPIHQLHNPVPNRGIRMKRILFVVLTGAFLALPMRSAGAQTAAFVRDVALRLNAKRADRGLRRLVYDTTLEKAAQSHAEWMARNQRMEHLEDPPRSLEESQTGNHHPANRVVKAGYFRWDQLFFIENRPGGAVVHPRPAAKGLVGEIIAKGANAGHPATQPPRIIAGWMHSPEHRRSILTPDYRAFGIGTACIGNDTYWCVVFAKDASALPP